MILETMPAVRNLPSEQKLLLIEELWEDMGISMNEQCWPVNPTHLDLAEAAVASGNYSDAIAALDSFNARVSARAGTFIPDVWRATRDTQNIAGELLAGANTLGFSIGYLRDFGN